MSLFRRRPRRASISGASSPEGELTARILREDSQTTVVVNGRVTVDSSPYLRSVLLDAIRGGAGRALVIDASGVAFMDTSGIATLLEASTIARDHSVHLRLIGVSGEPRLLAEVTELDQIFRAVGSEVELR